MSNAIIKSKLLISVIVLLLAVSCQEKPMAFTASLVLKSTEVAATASNQWVKVNAETEWTIRLTADDLKDGEEVGWAWMKKGLDGENAKVISGKGSGNILLGWSANAASSQRVCYLELTSDDQTVSYVFTQKASATVSPTVSVKNFKSDRVPDWLELPAMKTDDSHFYVNHYMKVASKKSRNYSIYLDSDACISLWVAYPLNRGLIGANTGKTDAWGLDPKVPKEYQPVIFSAFRGYQRGHQIPSADRYGGNNESTFYGTNMTPQSRALNAYAWALLEEKVRSWSYSFDTLYVVTGADIKGSSRTVSDNYSYYPDSGKSYSKNITVPSGYFKALLGYKKSGTIADTGKNGGYTAIGFYFEHKEYSKTDAAVMAQSMSIDELERKLGYDFFPNLSSKTSSADAVEATVSSWWK